MKNVLLSQLPSGKHRKTRGFRDARTTKPKHRKTRGFQHPGLGKHRKTRGFPHVRTAKYRKTRAFPCPGAGKLGETRCFRFAASKNDKTHAFPALGLKIYNIQIPQGNLRVNS